MPFFLVLLIPLILIFLFLLLFLTFLIKNYKNYLILKIFRNNGEFLFVLNSINKQRTIEKIDLNKLNFKLSKKAISNHDFFYLFLKKKIEIKKLFEDIYYKMEKNYDYFDGKIEFNNYPKFLFLKIKKLTFYFKCWKIKGSTKYILKFKWINNNYLQKNNIWKINLSNNRFIHLPKKKYFFGISFNVFDPSILKEETFINFLKILNKKTKLKYIYKNNIFIFYFEFQKLSTLNKKIVNKVIHIFTLLLKKYYLNTIISSYTYGFFLKKDYLNLDEELLNIFNFANFWVWKNKLPFFRIEPSLLKKNELKKFIDSQQEFEVLKTKNLVFSKTLFSISSSIDNLNRYNKFENNVNFKSKYFTYFNLFRKNKYQLKLNDISSLKKEDFSNSVQNNLYFIPWKIFEQKYDTLSNLKSHFIFIISFENTFKFLENQNKIIEILKNNSFNLGLIFHEFLNLPINYWIELKPKLFFIKNKIVNKLETQQEKHNYLKILIKLDFISQLKIDLVFEKFPQINQNFQLHKKMNIYYLS